MFPSTKEICTNIFLIPTESACPKPGTGFPTSYLIVFFVLSQLRCEAIVCFVDIGRLVDNHCLFSNNNKIANSNFINNVN